MVSPPLTFALAMPIGPSADGHPLLTAALRSIAAQGERVQLAVLDASGNAETAATLDRYSGLISHRRTGPDGGQAAAIQEGWDRLEGDVYGWLNADDLLYPDALAVAARHFEARPDASAVTGQSLFFDFDGASGAYTFTGLHPEVRAPDDALFRTNTISQPSTFVRRRALEAVGWLDTGLHYTMDWDLWVRLHAAGLAFVYEPSVLSAVLMTPGTKTSRFNSGRRREIGALVAEHAGWLAAQKSLVAFWLTHRAEAEAGRGVFTALRDGLQRRGGGGAREGANGGSETWPLFHFGDGPMRSLSRGGGPVEAVDVAPGVPVAVEVAAGQTVRLAP